MRNGGESAGGPTDAVSIGEATPTGEPTPTSALISPRLAPTAVPAVPLPGWIAATLVFIASGGVLVLEIVSLRLLAPYVGLTLEMSTMIIGIALAAIAVGAWVGGRMADTVTPRKLLGPLFCAGGVLVMAIFPTVSHGSDWVGRDNSSQILGIATLAIFLPAAVLSGITPVIIKLRLASLAETGSVVGRLSGIGTLGAIAATFGTGFILIALFSTRAILTGLGVGLLVVGIAVTLALYRRAAPAVVASAVVLATLAVGLNFNHAQPCDVETRYHCARVLTDPERSSGRILELDTLQHSYVDLKDASYLRFGYVRAIGSVLDTFRPQGSAVDALHIGAGGLTIPRYLAEQRPGSKSLVAEVDPGVLKIARKHLGFIDDPTRTGITTRVGDGRVVTRQQRSGGFDVVVGDAFGSIAVPWHLTTREYVSDVRRVLKAGGVYVLNVIDNPPLKFFRAELATIASVFPHVAVATSSRLLTGAMGGNFVVIASNEPLPTDALASRLADWPEPLTLHTETGDASSGQRILTDEFAPVDQLLTTA